MRRRALVLVTAAAAALGGAVTAHAEPVFVVKGRGWGHGIGMGQFGAQGFARQGWGHQRILAHYYRGTRLGRAEPREVRVLLAAGRKRFVLSSAKPFRISDAAGRRATLPADKVALGPRLAVRIDGKVVRLRPPVRFEGGAAPVALDGNAYRGALVVRSRGGSMSAVNHVALERYLRGVVPWEMPNHWHPEALKAQSVVARSYALATMKPRKIFDVFPDQRSQVYGGVRAEKPSTNLAVGATAGRVLFHGDRIASTFYHSTSGGKTAAIKDVWPRAQELPYLRPVPDPHDTLSPHHRWGPIKVTRAELASKLEARGLARARDVVVTRNGSGRAAQVQVRLPRTTHAVDAADFRVALGLRSTWFEIGVLQLEPPQIGAVYNRPFELRGIARGLRAPVIQRLDGTQWRQAAIVRPRPDGTFAAAVRPQRAGLYRVAAEQSAGVAVRVEVAPDVRLAAVAGVPQLEGTVRPRLPGARVSIQRMTQSGWRTVAAAQVDGGGGYTSPDALPAGDYRARVEPRGAFVSGTSAPVRLRSE